MIAATCRVSTRAVSAIVSPRPIWVLAVSISRGSPPSSATPTVKETRVRRLGLSKSRATDFGPASGRRPAVRLHRGRQAQHLGLLGRGEVVVAEEVPRHGYALSPWTWVRMAGSASTNPVASAWVRISGGASRTASGWTALTRNPAARAALTAAALCPRTGRRRATGPSPDTGEQRVVDGGDAAGQGLADRLDVLEQVVFLDRVEHRQGGGAGDRVTAEGGAVVAGDERAARLAEADAGADRQPAAEALGEGHHIGGDALGLVREPGAGAADAGLDLVEHEQRARLVAGAAGGGQVAGRGGITPPSPWVGSRMTPATWSSTASARAAASP